MSVDTQRLQGILRVLAGQLRNLPHDAVAALMASIEEIDQPVPEPTDPYAGLSDDELLTLASKGDQGALQRYVANRDAQAGAPAVAAPPVNPTPVYETPPTVNAGEGQPPQ